MSNKKCWGIVPKWGLSLCFGKVAMKGFSEGSDVVVSRDVLGSNPWKRNGSSMGITLQLTHR